MRALLVLIVMMPGLVAAQPFSQSMAQCAGMSRALSEWTSDARTAEAAEFAAGAWTNAAVMQAEGEGVGDPANYVKAALDATYNDWMAKGRMAVFSEDFRDWAAYCRKFGDHMGIKRTPDA